MTSCANCTAKQQMFKESGETGQTKDDGIGWVIDLLVIRWCLVEKAFCSIRNSKWNRKCFRLFIRNSCIAYGLHSVADVSIFSLQEEGYGFEILLQLFLQCSLTEWVLPLMVQKTWQWDQLVSLNCHLSSIALLPCDGLTISPG